MSGIFGLHKQFLSLPKLISFIKTKLFTNQKIKVLQFQTENKINENIKRQNKGENLFSIGPKFLHVYQLSFLIFKTSLFMKKKPNSDFKQTKQTLQRHQPKQPPISLLNNYHATWHFNCNSQQFLSLSQRLWEQHPYREREDIKINENI